EEKEDGDEAEESGSEWDDDGVVVLGEDSSKPITIRELEEQAEIDLDETQFALLDQEAARNLEQYEDATATATTTGDGTKPTKRIAAVNLDWDHVKASHLFKIFSSLLSLHPGSLSSNGKSKKSEPSRLVHGELLRVRIYPSEFGKKKMAEEDKSGPPTDLFLKKNKNKYEVLPKPVALIPRQRVEDEDDKDEDENVVPKPNNGEDYDQTALRRYQLERLRYYYAIATFSTVSAASFVYSELDGTELEQSANLFDLSYVPDDMTFEEDEMRDEATRETMVTAKDYKGLDFTTDALRHSKVKLTWDDDDPERMKVTRRMLSEKEIDEMDFKALLASSSSSSSASEEDDDHRHQEQSNGMLSKKEKAKQKAARLRALLLSGNEENLPEGWGGGLPTEKDGINGDMEVTFVPGLSAPDDDGTARSKSGSKEETTLERYQRKEKEKKKAKKEKRKERLLTGQTEEDGEDAGSVGGNNHGRASRKERETKKRKDRRDAVVDEDAFFGSDTAGDDSDDEQQVPSSSRMRSNTKVDKKRKGETFTPATDAELALLVDDDDELSKVLGGDGTTTKRARHFDMNEIVRAERRKEKGGSGKWEKKKLKKRKRGDGEGIVGASAPAGPGGDEDVELNMADPRFKAIREDHRFAIDPANPHFKKTKNMKKLLYGQNTENGAANNERKKKRQRRV
ncbi:pre-rRNA-processing protein esf1, partial [Serendipita sp. 399]